MHLTRQESYSTFLQDEHDSHDIQDEYICRVKSKIRRPSVCNFAILKAFGAVNPFTLNGRSKETKPVEQTRDFDVTAFIAT